MRNLDRQALSCFLIYYHEYLQLIKTFPIFWPIFILQWMKKLYIHILCGFSHILPKWSINKGLVYNQQGLAHIMVSFVISGLQILVDHFATSQIWSGAKSPIHVDVTNRPVHIYGKIKLEILSPISLPARCSAGFTFTSVHSNNLSIIQKSIFTHFLSLMCCFDIIIVTDLPIR